jgi:hypothetical protein
MPCTHSLNDPAEIIKSIDVPHALLHLRADGIIHVHYKKNTYFDIPLQLEMRMHYLELTQGKKGKFIFSADEGFVFSKEARENAKKLVESSPVQYYALIGSNLAYRIIGNFFIRMMKPQSNYKLVSNMKEAVAWLNSRG